jgi:hypothetical protein
MLDGHINTQGTLTKLCARRVLDEIMPTKAHEDEQKAAMATHSGEEVMAEAVNITSPTREMEKLRKLIKDEEHQEGGVK